jgi:MFS family permease
MSTASALRQPGFPWLWSGQTVSLLGSQVTVVALPLTAVLTLHATAGQMGVLRALLSVPFLLFGLLIGAWIDRRSRLGVLMAGNVGQAVVLATIPAAALAGHLSLPLLYLVAFVAGTFTVVLDVSYQAFVPSLVPAEGLVDANSRLEASRSVAGIAGPGLGGLLIQVLSPPIAILVDTVSFVICAILLRPIQDPEAGPRPARQATLLREMREGFNVVLGHPVLRAIAFGTTILNLMTGLETSIVFLFLVRTVHFSPFLVGLTVSLTGLGGFAGALAAGRAPARLPLQLVLGLGLFLCGAGLLLTASAVGPVIVVLPMLGLMAFGFGLPIFNVNQLSLRQSVTPARLQGRVHATWRTLTWGAIPIGQLLGGQLGEHVGLRQTIGISGLGILASALIIYLGVLLASRPPPEPSPVGDGGG